VTNGNEEEKATGDLNGREVEIQEHKATTMDCKSIVVALHGLFFIFHEIIPLINI